MKKILIAIAVLVVIGVFVVMNLRKEGSKIKVQVSEVARRDITKIITGTGSIKPKKQVNVSASAIGKVTKIAVKEGEYVRSGEFLLQIDPTGYQSAVDQLNAAIGAAEATLEMEQANVKKAEYDLERAVTLFEKNFISEEELRNARVNVEIQRARVKSAKEILSQHRANLKKARHDLREVRITADMSGIITALNVEEGENAIMGTLNNPGTVLLTIADLSEIEAEIKVDETEVVFVRVGQDAKVKLDAYPDTSFAGTVTEVGNSALRTQVGLGQESVDFKVVVAVLDSIPNIRPGLSAFAEITVAQVSEALSIPIQCLTVRRRSQLEDQSPGKKGKGVAKAGEEGQEKSEGSSKKKNEIEGVFVVSGGVARFQATTVGIAGESYFHVLSGLEDRAEVVSGPLKAINDLKNGDRVKITKRTTSEE